MDPSPFVRILVGNLALKFPADSNSSPVLPCFCKIKFDKFPRQISTIPVIPPENYQKPETQSQPHLAASFNLNKIDIDKLKSKRNSTKNPFPRLKVEVYKSCRNLRSCGIMRNKLLGTVLVPLDFKKVESRACVYQNSWVGIGENRNAQLFLNVKAEVDRRFVFRFDGEPECNPQVFLIKGNVKHAVFTCDFSLRNSGDRSLRSGSSSSESKSKSWFRFHGRQKTVRARERKGWSITIHDLSGSPVAMASIITPFVPSHSSNRVSRSNPGSWLILRPSTNTWQPWGRLDAWRESNKLGYRFTLLPESTTRVTTDSTISTKKGGKFTIDIAGRSTPVNSPRSSCEYASRRSSRAGSESGSECGFGLLSNCKYGDFVMSSTVEGAGRRSRPEVEVGVKHITCTEDAAVFVALAAAMDLCMDACRLFSHKLRKELRE